MKKNEVIIPKNPDAYEKEAIRRYKFGLKFGVSTSILENITYGYGDLDPNGFWEFPLYFTFTDFDLEGKI